MSVEAVLADQSSQPDTILIVEDEVLVRLMVAEHLRGCGYRVLEAASAAEAIKVLEAEIAVDILFTDVQLPGELDGFGLARWTRERRPKIRIIITSGLERSAHEASDLCDEEPYLRKPYDPASLVREIRRLLAD